ncbi:MAG: hypothetical protein IJ710_09240 [Prevotella sp.]|nr:hypothetical protein [Prevotella sp.]
MSETHHHHHHHRPDGASRFKQKSLNAIENRKKFAKILKLTLITIAILMAIAVCVVYTIN